MNSLNPDRGYNFHVIILGFRFIQNISKKQCAKSKSRENYQSR